MRTKTFDCIEMKRRGAERILKELKSLKDQEEELSYWKKANQETMQERSPQ